MTTAAARLNQVVCDVVAAHGGVRPVEQGEGGGLGAGTAQAKPKPGPGPVCCSLPGQPSDKKSDRVFGEGTFSDFFQDVFVTGER